MASIPLSTGGTANIQEPPGGFQDEGWYWDSAAGGARQIKNGMAGPVGDSGANWWTKQAGSSSGQSSSNPLQDVNKAIQDKFQELQNEVTKRFGEYQAGQPFRVDEVLAGKRKEASEQIDPYYDQILGDYLLGVERKIARGTDDTKDLLSELNNSTDQFTKENAQALAEATDKAEQGYASTGLFGSGEQLSSEGKIKEQAGTALSDYTGKVDLAKKQAQTNLTRNLEDISLERAGQLSDIGRNRYTDTESRASQLTKEAGQQYIQGFQQTLPTELQPSSGFDMLKSLGIYS